MQWQKAKTVMIWLFLFVDIFLLTFLILKNCSAQNPQAKINAIKVLKNNNVLVDSTVFLKKEKKMFAYEFKTISLDRELIDYLVSNSVKIDNNNYESLDKKTVLKLKSNHFFYENKNPKMEGFSKINEKNAFGKLDEVLNLLQIKKYVKCTQVSTDKEDYIVECSFEYDSKELFISKLNFVLNKDGIKKIDGNINIPNKNQGYNFNLSEQETILLNFSQNNQFSSPTKVISLKLGYYFMNYENILSAQAIPVYRIKTVDRIYIYDAREGIDSKQRELYFSNN